MRGLVDVQVLGRTTEIAEVVDRLRERRLVTITGPGGIGKTALAQVAALEVGPEFAYGAITIDLTRVDETDGVFEAIAGQLGYADFDSLMNSPSDQPALIVIDNCEHVLDAAADATARMLAACRMPTILTTSRSPLDLPEESIFALGPLPTPVPESDDVDNPSMQLLVRRARDHGVDLGVDEFAAAADVCRRLDGVPLAIELAAARLRTISLAELIDELAERPHALARRRFRGRASHRSVGELVSWSLDLVEPADQRFFVRLSVFAGPFTALMAHGVAAEPATSQAQTNDVLSELIAASLVTADTTSDVTWYRLLHPVRAVALDRLRASGELAATRSRFVDQVVTLAIDVIGRATGGWGADVLTELIALYDNIAASLRWTLEHDDEAARSLTLLAVLWGIVHQAHTAEIGAIGEEVLAKWPDPATPLWPDAAATVATCRYLVGRVDSAIELADSTLVHADASPFAPATLRRVFAQALRAGGRLTAAREMFREAAEAAAARAAHGFAMELWVDHGLVVAELGDVDSGVAVIEAVLAEAVERDAPINRVWAAAGLGAAVLRRDPSEAVPLIERALADARSIDYPAGRSFSLRALATARLELGDLPGAARALLDLVDELLQRGGLNDLRMALDLAASVLERHGDPRWADLALSAEALPVTTVATAVESDMFERARGSGQVLSTRDAYTTCRGALTGVLDAGGQRDEPQPVDAPTDLSAMVLEGDVWRVTFDARTILINRSKGTDDLAALLSSAGREISSLDLMGSSSVGAVAEDDIIDATARRQYEERVRELQAEIDQADDDNDIGRSERLRVELDTIVDHLTAALGLGGKSRRTTGDAERARSAVTQRIRATIKRIDDHHPTLATHLRGSVTTGTFCRYAPDPVVEWHVER